MIYSNIITEPWSWPYWSIMVTINVISTLVFIFLSIRMFKASRNDLDNSRYRKTLFIFGLIYVLVALYRSVFISSYTGRLAWFNTMANSMIVIRILATFAEISFAFLISLVLQHMNKELELPKYVTNRKWLKNYLLFSPYIIIICLSIAQLFAWTGLITQYLILFAIEETLWTLGFASILPLVIIQWINLFKHKKNDKSVIMYKLFCVVLGSFTIGYLLFQIAYQLPFGYYLNIANDFKTGIHLPLNFESFKLALYDFYPTRSFNEWGGIGFFIWHSGYFSICVWMNIYFAYGPHLIKK